MCFNSKGSSPLHSPQFIQAGENLKAEICKCGAVQIHLGPLTLRYTRGAFADLYQLVHKIKDRLDALQLPELKGEAPAPVVDGFSLEGGKKIIGEA